MVDNGTEHGAPKWLTKGYLENVLEKFKKNEKIQIKHFDISPAIPKGENYASIMTRIRITFEYGKGQKMEEKLSLIVKTAHEGDPHIETIYEPYQVFKTEMAMYEKVLPKLSELLKTIGDNDKVFAETIYVDFAKEAIIFEDLSVLDYVPADRIAGLDMATAKLALLKLAKMHASAAVLNERTSGSLEGFTRGVFNRHTRGFGVFFENMCSVCADFANECPELGSYYKEKLLKLRSHMVEYAIQAVEIKEGQFHTLNHGDFWINNIMLRFGDDRNPKKVAKDILIIDFQFSKWTSPAVDLHYFFNTSLETNLQLSGQEELIQFYHQVLSETLRLLKYKGHIPSLHELCVQIEDRRFYAVTSALANQAFMINDNTEDADIQALLFDDERGRNFRKMLYKNPIMQHIVKELLPYFDRRGLFDVTE